MAQFNTKSLPILPHLAPNTDSKLKTVKKYSKYQSKPLTKDAKAPDPIFK